jgi:hypothetical protein
MAEVEGTHKRCPYRSIFSSLNLNTDMARVYSF